jgi:hypothetical protein
VSELSKYLHESIVPFLDTDDYAILAAKLEAEAAELETGLSQVKQLSYVIKAFFLISFMLTGSDE